MQNLPVMAPVRVVSVTSGKGGVGKTATAVNLAAGVIRVGSREVLQCDSDPNNPDAGRVDLVIGGGR